MIEVTIKRCAADQRIRAFAVEGHAFFAKPGKDIVCAGVSAVTVGTVNAIETLLGIELDSEMDSGILRVNIPEEADSEVNAKLQLLLESMVVMIRSIEDSYGKYIKVQDILQ